MQKCPNTKYAYMYKTFGKTKTTFLYDAFDVQIELSDNAGNIVIPFEAFGVFSVLQGYTRLWASAIFSQSISN